jgi:hypothetical protein
MAAAYFQSNLYAIGGFSWTLSEALSLERVEVFDGSRWSLTASMNIARRYFGAVVYQCHDAVRTMCLYAIGGGLANDSNVALARSVEMFDGKTWQILPEGLWLRVPRMQHGVAVHQDKIFVAGGAHPFYNLPESQDTCFDGHTHPVGLYTWRTIEVFDGAGWGELKPACSMPLHPCRGQVALASFEDALWFSGAAQDSTADVSVLAYDDGTCVWKEAPRMNLGRTDTRIAVMSDTLFTVGGSRAPDFLLTDVEFITWKSSQWMSAQRLPEGRTIAAVAVAPCDRAPTHV